MTSAQYNAWTARLRKNPQAALALVRANKVLTAVGYVAYPTLLALVGVRGFLVADPSARELFWRELLVPAASFALVSFARSRVDAPRPYEVLEIEPLIHKDTRGRSFPSRHVFSAFVIAMGWTAWCVPVGVALLAVSSMLAVIRVLGGVHWPRDVVAGTLLGIGAGLLIL